MGRGRGGGGGEGVGSDFNTVREIPFNAFTANGWKILVVGFTPYDIRHN